MRYCVSDNLTEVKRNRFLLIHKTTWMNFKIILPKQGRKKLRYLYVWKCILLHFVQ